MKRIRDAQTILGMLENGELNKDASRELNETLAELCELSKASSKSKIKGSFTLKLNITADNGTVSIQAEIAKKVPKSVRRSSFYWVMDDGTLATEHPDQSELFDAPRIVEKAV